jgi:hypothetical protein
MNIVGFSHWYRREYGCSGLEELPERLERVWRTGTSLRDETADSLLAHNRYGEDESNLEVEEVKQKWKEQSCGRTTTPWL